MGYYTVKNQRNPQDETVQLARRATSPHLDWKDSNARLPVTFDPLENNKKGFNFPFEKFGKN